MKLEGGAIEIESRVSEAARSETKDLPDRITLSDKPEEAPRLTEQSRQMLQEVSGWPKKTVECIDSLAQYEIYQEAGLKHELVNGRECLVKADIDPKYIDAKTGMSNMERMSRGLPPIDAKTGEKIELHHMGQGFESPFAELTENSEHGDGNHSVLHPRHEGSWRHNPEQLREYQAQKRAHWKTRAFEIQASGNMQEG